MFDSLKRLGRAQLDETLSQLRKYAHASNAGAGAIRSGIGVIRRALGMTQQQLAQRLGTTRQNVADVERRERSGNITVSQLRQVAAALNCDLVCVLVPRASLEGTVEARAKEVAMKALKSVRRTMQLEDQETPISEAEIQDYIARHITERDLWNE